MNGYVFYENSTWWFSTGPVAYIIKDAKILQIDRDDYASAYAEVLNERNEILDAQYVNLVSVL